MQTWFWSLLIVLLTSGRDTIYVDISHKFIYLEQKFRNKSRALETIYLIFIFSLPS